MGHLGRVSDNGVSRRYRCLGIRKTQAIWYRFGFVAFALCTNRHNRLRYDVLWLRLRNHDRTGLNRLGVDGIKRSPESSKLGKFIGQKTAVRRFDGFDRNAPLERIELPSDG